MRQIGPTITRFGRGRWFAASLLWEPRDLWVGLFWRQTADYGEKVLHFYFCLLPCVPLHVTIRKATQ